MSTTITTGHREGTQLAAVKLELENIHVTKGELTPEIVVETARNKKSVLHKFFTWDDTKAARNFRLLEASMLIRSVRVRVSIDDESFRTRAFVLPEKGRGSYKPLEEVVRSEELSDALVQIARDELTAFRKKYSGLTKLSGLIQHIDKTLAEIST